MTEKFRDFQARAIRAALASSSDGIVFSETSRDALEKSWEALSEETRNNWRELAQLLSAILRNDLTPITNLDTNTRH